jgi:hypothetical protein
MMMENHKSSARRRESQSVMQECIIALKMPGVNEAAVWCEIWSRWRLSGS